MWLISDWFSRFFEVPDPPPPPPPIFFLFPRTETTFSQGSLLLPSFSLRPFGECLSHHNSGNVAVRLEGAFPRAFSPNPMVFFFSFVTVARNLPHLPKMPSRFGVDFFFFSIPLNGSLSTTFPPLSFQPLFTVPVFASRQYDSTYFFFGCFPTSPGASVQFLIVLFLLSSFSRFKVTWFNPICRYPVAFPTNHPPSVNPPLFKKPPSALTIPREPFFPRSSSNLWFF